MSELRMEILRHGWTLDAWNEQLPRSEANLIFADPPYNIGVSYDDDKTMDHIPDWEYNLFCTRTLLMLELMLKPGGTLWWMCPEKQGDFVGPELTRIVGPRVHRIIWEESFARYQQKRLTKDYRFIFCHQKPGGELTFNPDAIREMSVRQEMGDKRADPRGRVPGMVWKMRRLQGTSRDRVDWHPTQLPPELLKRIVLGWSNSKDLVVDAFAGSGNMGLICRKHGRNHLAIDSSQSYCDKIRERWESHAE